MPNLSGGYDPKAREARLGRLGGRQHGAVSLEQLLELGFDESWIKRAVKAGRLIRLYRGVYAYGHPRADLKARAVAAMLAMGPAAVVSHGTAAALLGLRPEEPGPIDVTLPKWRNSRPGIHTHESRSLASDDIRVWYGVRLTTPIRTLVDLADELKTDELELALARPTGSASSIAPRRAFPPAPAAEASAQ